MAVEVEHPQARVAVARPRPRKRVRGVPRLVLLALVLAASIVAGYLAYQRFGQATSTTVSPTTMPVSRGTIAATVTIAGSTAAVSQAKLTFESAGRLVQIPVKAGDSVKAGDVLARLDPADLELQVAQAKVALEQARLTYDSAVTDYNDLKAGSKPEDIADAEAAVRNAQVAVEVAQRNLEVARNSTTNAQTVRDRQYEVHYYESAHANAVNSGNYGQEDLDRMWRNVLTAREKLAAAQQQAANAIATAENELAKAKDSLRKAQDSVQELLAGPTTEQLRAANPAAKALAVRLAEATLEQKQLLLKKATLVAPFDGVVDSISVNVGEQVAATTAVLTLVNMKQFRVEARVSEADVARLSVGQSAAITFDALPNERLTARITSIGAIAVVSSGVVNYPVALELGPTQAAVRPGMTASVAVQVARRENVLLVPNRAVRSQGTSRTVQVMVEGKTETRTVSIGMTNDQFTEVLDGLKEGDVVVIPATTTSATNVPGMPGGAGVMPPMR